jgi:cell division protein FtsQ
VTDTQDVQRTQPLPIDPRIKARRIAVTRQEGRRRLHILMAFAGVACVVGALVAAAHSALLDVDRVDVTGAAHTDRADILRAAGLEHKRYMMDVHAGSARRAIEALPWVAKASVARHWPGTVKITVTERTPVASVATASGGQALVDSSGRVLATTPAGQRPTGILALDGLPPAPAPGAVLGVEGRAALAVATALPEQVRPRIASVQATSDDIVLRLTGAQGTTVEMGTPDQLDAKVVALSTMLAKLDLKTAKVIDLRVPAAPVLTRAG